jgi:hypothetical protein
MSSPPLISLNGVAKTYASMAAPVVALHEVNLDIQQGVTDRHIGARA